MEKNPVIDSSNASSSANSTAIGYRFSTLNKSFKFALRSLLTSCSKEEFCKAFSSFTNTEKDFLHRIFLQEDFEAICLKTQVGATLDAVEEIVEEQDLDLLFSNRSNIGDVAENLSTAKKDEIQRLMHMVQLGEEHNQRLRNQLQLLKKGSQVLSDASHAVEKIKSINSNYGANSSDEMRDV
ncbi:hypothetical protein TSUD_209980 [Trifolium subterraneum]|uniref:Uncharacterized protein n=1 Tax=Trifolium subterraneum TaxID=3900 RepID=A0A2Z6MPJ7_TRISU|nr:hypothetical protein TSUD_209980 [Trifolium subterraneum]